MMDIISTDYESVGRVGGGVGHALYIQKKRKLGVCVYDKTFGFLTIITIPSKYL